MDYEVSVNTYRHTFLAPCPSDEDSLVSRLKIKAPKVILVEQTRIETALIKKGYPEQIELSQ